MGCLGSIFRFTFFAICIIFVLWFGGSSIIAFFSALFGGSWMHFWTLFSIWITANYGIDWLFEVHWKDEDAGKEFFAIFILFISILIYRGLNKLGRVFIRG